MVSTLTSVIIPSYNRAHYVPQTVESVLGQIGAEVEVIVVDDGSTDDTAAVVEQRKREWGERFRYYWQENSERSVARNHGLRYARGEFVAFLDSDDVWRPNHARTCVHALREQPEVAAVYSDHGLIDADGRMIRNHVPCLTRSDDSFKRDLCLKRLILFPTAVLVRRSVLDEAFEGTTEIFDRDIIVGEDWLVWASLVCHAPLRRVSEATVWRRLHPNSTWGDPARFVRHSRRATERVIETGLPASLGISGRRIVAINESHCAYAYYLSGEWHIARQHLAAAVRQYPAVLREPDFWRVAARLCVGKKLSRSIRNARHKGAGASLT